MIYLILLLTALAGTAEDVPVTTGEVVTEECNVINDCDTPPPSELPGPHPQ